MAHDEASMTRPGDPADILKAFEEVGARTDPIQTLSQPSDDPARRRLRSHEDTPDNKPRLSPTNPAIRAVLRIFRD
jgi:hypothetical protein